MNSIKGKIEDQNSTFVIEKNTSIHGEIIAENVELFGELEGSIKASGIVTIYPNAKMNGWIESSKLVVHPGSIVKIKNNPNP